MYIELTAKGVQQRLIFLADLSTNWAFVKPFVLLRIISSLTYLLLNAISKRIFLLYFILLFRLVIYWDNKSVLLNQYSVFPVHLAALDIRIRDENSFGNGNAERSPAYHDFWQLVSSRNKNWTTVTWL